MAGGKGQLSHHKATRSDHPYYLAANSPIVTDDQTFFKKKIKMDIDSYRLPFFKKRIF